MRETTAPEIALACANEACTLVGEDRTFWPEVHFLGDLSEERLPLGVYNPECPECEAPGVEVLAARGNDKTRPI